MLRITTVFQQYTIRNAYNKVMLSEEIQHIQSKLLTICKKKNNLKNKNCNIYHLITKVTCDVTQILSLLTSFNRGYEYICKI